MASKRVYLRGAEDAAKQTIVLAREEGFVDGAGTVLARLETLILGGTDPNTAILELREGWLGRGEAHHERELRRVARRLARIASARIGPIREQ